MPKKQVHRRDGIYTRPDAPGYWGSWTTADGRRVRRRFKVPTLEQAKIMLAAERLKVEETIKFGRPLPTEETFEFGNLAWPTSAVCFGPPLGR